MISKQMMIENFAGLHLRPAGVLCNEAIKYKSTIEIKCEDRCANAKSILSILGACIRRGHCITVTCNGPDEDAALQGVTMVINNGLN